MCELANGRKEVLPLLEAAGFYIVSMTAECWNEFCSDLGESHRFRGTVLSLTLREHPVGDMAGQRRRGGAAEV